MTKLSPPANISVRKRYAIYGVLALLGLLTLAYFDAGEEPIRPISQAVELPGVSAEEN